MSLHFIKEEMLQISIIKEMDKNAIESICRKCDIRTSGKSLGMTLFCLAVSFQIIVIHFCIFFMCFVECNAMRYTNIICNFTCWHSPCHQFTQVTGHIYGWILSLGLSSWGRFTAQ